MNEGASELAQLVYAAVGEESLRMRMPRFLFRAGKVEEARALLLDNLREFPQEPAALLEAAKLEVSLGDMVAAESHYREALEWVGSNLRLRRQLVWELEALLTTTEQIEALHVLQRQEKRFLESLPSRLRAPKPLRREAPKVGRNDPCPCGSGKKSKKCCARAS
jgi:tetratricopeptide (TPR) repeat protein